jgi:mannose-6-phosphate isomerase-like protein (cupin superfamily)
MAGKDVRVRLFTLAPGEVFPWHSHSEIADEFFVTDGELTVETRGPDDYRTLCVGERYRVNAQHQTSNCGAKDCRFLIVQGVGRYDFNDRR